MIVARAFRNSGASTRVAFDRYSRDRFFELVNMVKVSAVNHGWYLPVTRNKLTFSASKRYMDFLMNTTLFSRIEKASFWRKLRRKEKSIEIPRFYIDLTPKDLFSLDKKARHQFLKILLPDSYVGFFGISLVFFQSKKVVCFGEFSTFSWFDI